MKPLFLKLQAYIGLGHMASINADLEWIIIGLYFLKLQLT